MAGTAGANAKVLIVGGGSGMGLALAKRCVDAGDRVIIAGRDEGRLALACRALEQEGFGHDHGQDPSTPRMPVERIALDVSQEDQVARLFERVGPLDHVVSTAADIAGAYALLPALDLEAAHRAVASKLYGPLLLAKHGAPRLSSTGSITFVAGIAAHRPAARGAVVAAVNAGLEGLVRALAVELAPVRVNAVSPGWVDTSIWSFVAGERKDEVMSAMAKRLPVGRVGKPDDVADALRFLMGNAFTTGTILHVEGGHRLV